MPATYRTVLSNRDFRALFLASALSWFGDYMARAAIAALVYRETGLISASAAAFALSYLPSITAGPVLAALADRYSSHTVLVSCDLARMLLVGTVAIPGMPVWAMLVLMYGTALLGSPFDAARSALVPRLLPDRDLYVLGVSLQNSALQAVQILGYFAGGAIALGNPRLALGFDALTFGVSALFVGLLVKVRRQGASTAERKHLLRETGEGIRFVFGHPVLRPIVVVTFAMVTFVAVPEGLAAGWAAQLGPDRRSQGLIMAAAPVGMLLGGLVLPRILPGAVHQRILSLLAVASPLPLIPALWEPPLPVVIVMVTATGFLVGGFSPAANALFVQALPDALRGRAFGVVGTGMQLLQGGGIFITGALSEGASVPVVIGGWCAGGLLLMLATGFTWPRPHAIESAIADAVRRSPA